jgi:hypothetical protein
MDRQQGWFMATTEETLGELLDRINAKSSEDSSVEWITSPIKPLTSYSIGNGGTSHPTYGAVPNVTIGGGYTGVSSPIWTTTTSGITQSNPTIGQSGKVVIQGDNADLVIGDKSLRTWMERVEERLNILTPNPEMEKEWDELRRLGERYRELEKECREKSDMWNKLRKIR